MNPKRDIVGLIIVLMVAAFTLSACGGDKADTASSGQTTLSENPTSTIRPTSTTRPLPTPTSVDPGPYFSPGKAFPNENPATYTGPADVGDFQQDSVTGQANTAAGVTALYTNSDNAGVVLNIYYASDKPSAMAFIEQMGTNGRLTTPPEFLLLDENNSYTLFELGDGRSVYGWTRELWIFVATSGSGRAALDAFMREFPY